MSASAEAMATRNGGISLLKTMLSPSDKSETEVEKVELEESARAITGRAKVAPPVLVNGKITLSFASSSIEGSKVSKWNSSVLRVGEEPNSKSGCDGSGRAANLIRPLPGEGRGPI